MPPIKSILVPTDFSPASDIAFQYAVDMALTQEARSMCSTPLTTQASRRRTPTASM